MRRLFLRFTVAILAFSLGLVVNQIFAAAEVTRVPQVQKIEPVRPVIVEVPVPKSLPTPTPNVVFDYDASRFAPDGLYSIVGDQKDFVGFDSLEIWTSADDSGRIGGGINVYTSSYHAVVADIPIFGLINGRRFYFVTTPRSEEGVEYKFDGEFLQGGTLMDVAENKTVLKGKVTKWKDGQKVGERVVKFSVTHTGC